MKKITNLVVLLILDGWGIAPDGKGNSISLAKPRNFKSLIASFPHTQLEASGEAVGLPKGEAGNTETGHLNLGAGRIVYQDLMRINMSIAEGSFFKNPVFIKAIEHCRQNNSKLHLLGLVGGGSIHASMGHLFALLHFAREQNFDNVYLHIFTDGRDSLPSSALLYLDQLKEAMQKEKVGTIASIMGRYWAMDRDFRWDRTAKAYFALTDGIGDKVSSAYEAVQNSYKAGITDEFINPAVVVDDSGKPVGLIEENDAVIFFNFRIDRPRQLTKAFVLDDFESKAGAEWGFDPFTLSYYQKRNEEIPSRPVFKRGEKLKNLFFVTMTEYQKGLNVYVAFPKEIVAMPLARVLAEKGIMQLHAAESEKERFVTYYFNGQHEFPFPGEDRLIIPSPKVPTYDLLPEMSALRLTEAVLNQLSFTPESYGFVVVNLANPDMVGHTGNIDAASKACLIVDECIGQIVKKILAIDGVAIITSDHGNAEEMIDPITGQSNTEHSTNPVPFIVVGNQLETFPQTLSSGILADVAPTILSLLGIEKPLDMTGKDLLSIY